MVAKFDPKELEKKEFSSFGRTVMRPSYPLNQHDAFKALQDGEPWWMLVQASDATTFCPDIIPDTIARGFVLEASAGKYAPVEMKGGKDMFGIDWEYIAQVRGSMVRPGKPFLESIDEWYDKVVWPDVDSWDWEGCAARNRGTFIKEDHFNVMWVFNGFFERLISMMEFQNALMAIFDEDFQDDVNAFFTRLTDLYIEIFDHVFKYFPEINGVFVHDDWGSQKETFFSPELVEKMLVPHMKRFTDYLHSHGVFCELHSCGNNYKQVPNMIKAGWDMWAPQLMNDCYKIYDDFGDKIVIATFPMNLPEDIKALPTTEEQGEAFAKLPEEEQRRIAREFVHRVSKPGKPSTYNFYASYLLTDAFRDEMYQESRKIYSGEIEA